MYEPLEFEPDSIIPAPTTSSQFVAETFLNVISDIPSVNASDAEPFIVSLPDRATVTAFVLATVRNILVSVPIGSPAVIVTVTASAIDIITSRAASVTVYVVAATGTGTWTPELTIEFFSDDTALLTWLCNV